MLIREIEERDVEDVVSLWQECGITRSWNDPHKDIAFARASDNCAVLLGVIDDHVAATIITGHDGHRGWVYYLVVATEYRRQGIGKAMMSAAETWLRKARVWKLNLMVRQGNAEALKFYERLGFKDAQVICLQMPLGSD